MIALLRGRLLARRASASGDAVELVVETGGVGYRVTVPAGLAGRVVPSGDRVEVHTSLQVREDAMDLYGFPSVDTRDLFELLLTVSGVGPKLGLAILGTLAPEALRRAVGDGDVDTLTVVSGIGRKSAQRLVLELKDKLGSLPGDGDGDASAVGGDAASSSLGEVRLALIELGYSTAEAQRALRDLDGDGEVGDLLRAALRSLSVAAGSTGTGR